jgi:hypothetical protein
MFLAPSEVSAVEDPHEVFDSRFTASLLEIARHNIVDAAVCATIVVGSECRHDQDSITCATK